jgi:hypothetical protein
MEVKSISTVPYLSKEILEFQGRKHLEVLLGVSEVPDDLYRLCRTLRTAHAYNAEPEKLQSYWEAFFRPVEASNGAQATHTPPMPQSPLGAAVRKAVDQG